MSHICVDCVKDKNIKELITISKLINTCSLCNQEQLSIDYENSDFFSLVKAIVRFNYSEWEYNTHWGGDDYESLFYGKDNIFFLQERALSEDLYEELVNSITSGPVYEDYDKGISIFAGYTNGMQNMLLKSIKTSSDSELIKLAARLKSENYFKIEIELLEILKGYADIANTIITENESFYRARIGCADKKRNFSYGFESEYHYVPYSHDNISSPPPFIASAGRINRPGVSFLYCATDIYTAVSEVRPHPGDLISIGKFTLLKQAKIFDLSESKLLHFYTSDEKLDSYIPLSTLSNFMNKVIPPSERQQYSFTQLIADCIRQIGFDGIIFNSTVGEGRNVVLFDPYIAKYVENESGVIKIEGVKYHLKQEKLVSPDEIYNLNL